MAEENNNTEESKRPRKLAKEVDFDSNLVKITVLGGSEGEMVFDTNELPDEIRSNLIPFGISHKLGDSAAGKEGAEAEEAIKKVWEGLMAGDWTVRTPAQPKVTVKQLTEQYDKLPDDAKEQARKLLESLGIPLPS